MYTATRTHADGILLNQGIYDPNLGYRPILGIDPGLGTGWALVDKDEVGKPRLLRAGVIDVRNIVHAYRYLGEEFGKLLQGVLDQSSELEVWIEQGFIVRGGLSCPSVELRGVIKFACEVAGLTPREMNPMRVRAEIGHGRLKDAALRRLVCEFFCVPERIKVNGIGRALFVPSHIVDAAALAWAAHADEGGAR